MAIDLPEKIRNAIEGPQFWALATTNPDGSPQVSTVWVNAKDGNILINSALGRKKPRNSSASRVSLSRGSIPRTGTTPPRSRAASSRRTPATRRRPTSTRSPQKYLGQSPYPWRKEGEQRVSFVIEPTHVYHQDP